MRVDLDYFEHWKTRKMVRLLGPAGETAALKLWRWASRHAADGDLSGHDPEEIAAACDWIGKPQKLVEALLECRLIEREGKRMIVHDWDEHQGALIAFADKEAARQRARRARIAGERAASKQLDLDGHEDGAAPEPNKVEPGAVVEPPPVVVLRFQTSGDVSSWDLTAAQIEKWAALYPGLDVEAACRKAFAWVDAKSERRKTARGMKAFLVRWLNGDADQGRSRFPDSNRATRGREHARPVTDERLRRAAARAEEPWEPKRAS